MDRAINFAGESCTLKAMEYDQKPRVAVKLLTEEGIPMSTATLFSDKTGKQELVIKDYSENAGMLEALINAGFVKKPHRYIPLKFNKAPVVKMTDKLKKIVKTDTNINLEK